MRSQSTAKSPQGLSQGIKANAKPNAQTASKAFPILNDLSINIIRNCPTGAHYDLPKIYGANHSPNGNLRTPTVKQ